MKAYIYLFTCAFLLIAGMANAQDDTNVTESGNTVEKPPRNNFYDRYIYTEKRVLEYPYIHEKDVFFERMIWREIDIREKFNHRFKNENDGQSFIELLLAAAKKGDVSLYTVEDDRFTNRMTEEETSTIGVSFDTVFIFDPDTYEEKAQVVENVLDPTDIKRYRIKEVWFFDEERSELKCRILGIAPIQDRLDQDGNVINSGPMFWLYYPEAREVLARFESFNYFNDAQRFTWEDVFEARLFHSYITKENNVYNRRVKDYKKNPIDVLLESDKLKQQIFHTEHDLWTY